MQRVFWVEMALMMIRLGSSAQAFLLFFQMSMDLLWSFLFGSPSGLFMEIRKLVLGEKDEHDVGERNSERERERLNGYVFFFLSC